MLVRRVADGLGVDVGEERYIVPAAWDALFHQDDPAGWLRSQFSSAEPVGGIVSDPERLPLIGRQEVWAAGVTYRRSRDARMEEARAAGGDSHYDRVYEAPRPEIFFKATPHRVVGDGQEVRIRSDARWNVPEPELTLAINRHGRVFGYTIGNDMSSRDIEAENPLYLPQAKVYDACCALGPALLLCDAAPPAETPIVLDVTRDERSVFRGETTLSQMKRHFDELVAYLWRDNRFPDGCYLMTGTGIVPPDEFSLRSGDTIHITIDPIGTLTNRVAA